jgi:hypothetical protein
MRYGVPVDLCMYRTMTVYDESSRFLIEQDRFLKLHTSRNVCRNMCNPDFLILFASLACTGTSVKNQT